MARSQHSGQSEGEQAESFRESFEETEATGSVRMDRNDLCPSDLACHPGDHHVFPFFFFVKKGITLFQ